jgi:hypothetical protein
MRVGIIATARWVAAVFGYATWHYIMERSVYPQAVSETCKEYALNPSRCDALHAHTQEEWKRIPFDWTRPAILALGPLPLFWGLGWLLAARSRRSSD